MCDCGGFPPLFKDLGKAAKELFNKGFGFGAVKMEAKTRSESGFQVKALGSNNTDTGISGGHLETSYKLREAGLSFKHRWDTDNRLQTELLMEDRPARGATLGVDTSFVPNTGEKSATLKTGYRCAFLNAGCDLDFVGAAAPGGVGRAPPRVRAAGVLGYMGLLAGYQMTLDPAAAPQGGSKLTQSNVALGFRAPDFQLLATVSNGTEFGASVYQEVNGGLQAASSLSWTVGQDSPRLAFAAKYRLDRDVSLQAKVDNACLVGLGYTQTLRPGVKLTVSAQIDGRNFNGGGHKVGMGIEFEA